MPGVPCCATVSNTEQTESLRPASLDQELLFMVTTSERAGPTPVQLVWTIAMAVFIVTAFIAALVNLW
jgi:hypothetical protein